MGKQAPRRREVAAQARRHAVEVAGHGEDVADALRVRAEEDRLEPEDGPVARRQVRDRLEPRRALDRAGEEGVVVPDFWRLEIGNALLQATRRKRLKFWARAVASAVSAMVRAWAKVSMGISRSSLGPP